VGGWIYRFMDGGKSCFKDLLSAVKKAPTEQKDSLLSREKQPSKKVHLYFKY
jgi:hypothetical protein